MDTKLTLRLDKKVIDRAKKYAIDHNKSLSKVVENYLKSIVEKEGEMEISPFVKSMSTGSKLPLGVEEENIHMEKLLDKHQ